MQITQISGDGLSRVYGVRVGADELGEKLEAKIAEIMPRLNLRGFRPGKVPVAHVRRMYGKQLMSEVVEQTLDETSKQVVAENALRVAAQPDLTPQSNMEAVIAGNEDLNYELNVEVMPDFEPMDVTKLELSRQVYEPSTAEVDESLADLAKQSRTFEARTGKTVKAHDGDEVTIDFVGRIDGEAFEGGSAEGAQLVLGSGQFIPGFEEQLVGAKSGDEVTVKVTFPESYSVERLKGKEAEFEVKVGEVKAPQETAIDDALAERLGMGDLEALKNALKINLESEYAGKTRYKLKRALLDQLDVGHDFPLPPRMVEAEFTQIWGQVEAERERGELAPEDEGKSEDELRGEYRKIAERRVRLGLILAEIGRRNFIIVTDPELDQAMRQEAMRYGPQAQQIFDLMRGNDNAKAQLRAPIFEEKVVDLILTQAKVTDKAVSKDELMAEDELPEGYGEAKTEAKPAKAAKAKKAKAEPAAEAAPAEAAPAEAAEAAPAPAKKKAAKPAKAEAEPAAAAEPEAAPAKPKRAAKAKSE
ncbi:MAG TPA: trigger factor [Caulobacteraceae bacterium]|nr:trigger factor [Caulobacteraceae bacterium]